MQKQLTICGNVTSDQQENTLEIEQFLKDNYLFRRNVLNGKVEFATLPADEPVYRVLTQQALNSIIIRAKREAVVEKGSPKSEIMELVNSEEVPVYDPIREYLDCLPQWDGRNWRSCSVDCQVSAQNSMASWPYGFARLLRIGSRWTLFMAMSVCLR